MYRLTTVNSHKHLHDYIWFTWQENENKKRIISWLGFISRKCQTAPSVLTQSSLAINRIFRIQYNNGLEGNLQIPFDLNGQW